MKQVKCFLGEKRVCENRRSQAGSEKEPHPRGSFTHLHGVFLPFLSSGHPALPDSESTFGLNQGPPMYAHAFPSQDGF